MINHRLTMAAIGTVAPVTIRNELFSSADVEILISKWRQYFQKQKRLDFDDPRVLSDDEYRALTTLSKDQFNDLMTHISTYDIYNSSNRSIRTAIALLLCKLRVGLSNKLLAILFHLPDAKTVSRTLESARRALMSTFVPFNLGLNHISRQEIIDKHASTISREVICSGDNDKAIVVVDDTYIYIQVK